MSGGLDKHIDELKEIMSSGERDAVLSHIAEGVDVSSFFRHFMGNFKGTAFGSGEQF